MLSKTDRIATANYVVGTPFSAFECVQHFGMFGDGFAD